MDTQIEFNGTLDDEEGIEVVIDGRISAGIEHGGYVGSRFKSDAPGVTVSYGPQDHFHKSFPDEAEARAWILKNVDDLAEGEEEIE